VTTESRFDQWFRKFNSWDLSHSDLLRCAYVPGTDEGDVVYTSPKGHCMTRFMCRSWIDFYSAASAGWNAALKDVANA
jgi:hypothetical protein